MKFESMLLQMKDRMPERRFIHTRGVAETATQLAAKYGEDIEKAEIAGILHDSVKYAEKSWLKEIIISEQMDPMLLNFHHELWHAPVGSYVARQEFNIEDADILNAIQYHTTGRAGMSNLEKIVYIADMIEPSRSFPGVEVLREIANQDLEEGMLSCVQHSMTFLIKKDSRFFRIHFIVIMT